MPSDEEKYSVGWGKPPRHTRFKKGQSGTPGGRPKGFRNMTTILDQTLSEKLAVIEKGRRKSITKREGIVKLTVNKGLSGDIRFIRLLREISPHLFLRGEEPIQRPPDQRDLKPPSDEEKIIWCLELVKALDEIGQLPVKARALLQEFATRKC
jgi:hypothetical protein